MEWNLKIPKILHLYWGGENFHFLRYLTVKSFINHNPDWEVMFWYPKQVTREISWLTYEQKYPLLVKDFTSELSRLPVKRIPFDFEEIGFQNTMPEVHKSDILRLHLLSTTGGVWSDMDIIYFRPMSELYFNTPEYQNIETFYCNHRYGHSIGFLMASVKNNFFATLMDYARQEYIPIDYQSVGCRLYNRHFTEQESIDNICPSMNIDMDVIYSHDASNISDIYEKNVTNFNDKSIALHWYGGDPIWREFLQRTNGGYLNLNDSVISNLIKRER